MSAVAICPHQDGSVEVHGENETVWLAQEQMGWLLGRDRTVIGRHINALSRDGELDRESNVQKLHIAPADRPTMFYNLDVVVSVGYRVKSRERAHFRQWASGVLRDHLIRGYTRNRWLQRYDEGLLSEPKARPGGLLPAWFEATAGIARPKTDFATRGVASPLFGNEREEGLQSIPGNIDQSVFGAPAYPCLESHAAHLLYCTVNNQAFTYGHKRIGSLLFVDFLHRNGRLFQADCVPVINGIGLAALSLLVAESRPVAKETLIRLIMNMFSGEGA